MRNLKFIGDILVLTKIIIDFEQIIETCLENILDTQQHCSNFGIWLVENNLSIMNHNFNFNPIRYLRQAKQYYWIL